MRVFLQFALICILMPGWTFAAGEKHGRPCPANHTYVVDFDETDGFQGVCLETKTDCDGVSSIPSEPKWTTDRFLGSAAAEICVCGGQGRVKISEVKRRSRLGNDLTTLISLLQRDLAAKCPVCEAYRLKHRRSTVTLSFVEPKKDQPTHQFSVLTGPREQWALSVNAAINKIEQLEIKETDGINSLQLKEAPTRPYLGLDFLTRGDYASDYLNGLVIKLLLEGSSTPTDSYGIALGYRFRGIKSSWFSLDAFSPFVGYLWTNQDEMQPDGTLVEGGDRTGDWIFGVSFNLDKASNWLKF